MYDNLPTPLSREEELRLFAAYNDPGASDAEKLAARGQLMTRNIRLVVKLVRNYARTRPLARRHEDDLIGALIEHMPVDIDAFDPSRGFKFSTYLSCSLYRRLPQIVRAVAFAVRLPANYKQDRGPLSRTHQEWDRWTASGPSDCLAIREVDTAQGEFAAACLGLLNPREQQIIRLRLGLGGADPVTLEDVGREIGVSKERVRQIQERAYQKLRNAATERGLTAAAVA